MEKYRSQFKEELKHVKTSLGDNLEGQFSKTAVIGSTLDQIYAIDTRLHTNEGYKLKLVPKDIAYAIWYSDEKLTDYLSNIVYDGDFLTFYLDGKYMWLSQKDLHKFMSMNLFRIKLDDNTLSLTFRV